MEFAKDLLTSLRHRVHEGGEAASALRCDWQALSARLQAGHAARQVLQSLQVEALRRPGGSFAVSQGQFAGRAEYPSQGVNPTGSTDGKRPEGITTAVVAAGRDDGRG